MDSASLVRRFPVTRRSAIEAARSGDVVERARGLDTVAQAYWRPVYSYLRLHWRKSHEEAADLTQEFFADLIDQDLLARFDPQKARLRTWLRVCVARVRGWFGGQRPSRPDASPPSPKSTVSCLGWLKAVYKLSG